MNTFHSFNVFNIFLSMKCDLIYLDKRNTFFKVILFLTLFECMRYTIFKYGVKLITVSSPFFKDVLNTRIDPDIYYTSEKKIIKIFLIRFLYYKSNNFIFGAVQRNWLKKLYLQNLQCYFLKMLFKFF